MHSFSIRQHTPPLQQLTIITCAHVQWLTRAACVRTRLKYPCTSLCVSHEALLGTMFVLRPTRLFSVYVVVTYEALSGTAIFVIYGALSGTILLYDLQDSSRCMLL